MKITEQDILETKNEALAQGLAKGRAEGLAEGLAKGKLEERFKILKNLIRANMTKPDMVKILETDEKGIDSMILAMS